MVPFIQLKKLSQQRLASNNDATDQTLLWLILSPAMEWLQSYSPYQKPLVVLMWMRINSIEELSCESDLSLVLLAILWPVWLHTGAHKMIISSTMEESLHKDELSVSQAERNVHHFFQSEQWCSSDLSWRQTETGLITDCTNPSHYHAIKIVV